MPLQDSTVSPSRRLPPARSAASRWRPSARILTAGSGGVAIGDRVTSDGAGKGIATTTEDDSVAGIAATAAAEDADFEIDIRIGEHVP
jgi:hypothetical protein